MPTLLDGLLKAALRIMRSGVALPTRDTLDIVGAEVVDDPVLLRTRLTISPAAPSLRTARSVIAQPVPNLNAFTTHQWDMTYAQGDLILLAGQGIDEETSYAENGPWLVGESQGEESLAPLTRPAWFSGQIAVGDLPLIYVRAEGFLGGTVWFYAPPIVQYMPNKTPTVGIDDGSWFPFHLTIDVQLEDGMTPPDRLGQWTASPQSGLAITLKEGLGHALSARYGVAAIDRHACSVFADLAAGGVNTADFSILRVTILNQYAWECPG